MSLSRLLSRQCPEFCILVRLSSSSTTSQVYPKIQLAKPTNEAGFFQYTRNNSRNKNASGPIPQQGDLPLTFLFRRLGHAYEVYPLILLCGFWLAIFCVFSYASFGKIEVWLDRSKSLSPADWERSREDYWKKPTVLFDLDGRTHKRLEIMEILQDEMLEAAKKRGTR
ncbi:unnamed protein product [Auanema sp. JU1783]|nr:unnamed protein product [Auanema sp. JU1783]